MHIIVIYIYVFTHTPLLYILIGEAEDDKAQSYEVPAAALRLETQQWFQAGVTLEEAQLRLKEIKIVSHTHDTTCMAKKMLHVSTGRSIPCQREFHCEGTVHTFHLPRRPY